MKHFLSFFLFLYLCSFITEAQNNIDIPGAVNVLVVYNLLDQISTDIKDYYQNARSIPTINILGLENLLDNVDVYDPATQTTHQVGLRQQD